MEPGPCPGDEHDRIDYALDAAEQGELEEAWKWMREGHTSIWKLGKGWTWMDEKTSASDGHDYKTVDEALITAYRASKGGENG